MRKFYIAMSTLAILLMATTARAAVSGLPFYQSSGTYTEITGGTQHISGAWDDQTFANIPIGFTFNFNGTDFTTLFISCNGYVCFGGGTLGYSPISSTTNFATGGCIAGMGRDLQGIAGLESEVRSELSGTEPNRVFTIQWKNFKRYGYAYNDDTLNMQVKIYETTNRIEIVYGNCVGSAYNSAIHPQVGLRGITNGDFNNRTTTTDWTATTAGTANNATCTLNRTVFPPSGLTFAWQSMPQTFVSSTCVQNLNPAFIGDNNAWVIDIQAVMSGDQNPLHATSITVSTNGTTDPADIDSARIYYGTGSFSTATQFGSTWISPSGSYTFVGDQALAHGVNHFWLAYFISPSATPGHVVDGECSQIWIGGIMRIPDVTAPNGSREIISKYASLPYYQNFNNTWMNLNSLRDVPDFHWVNTPATGNNSWRRQDDGASAGWTFVATGLVIPYEGAGAADFHSYGASSGLVGTLDLYADLSISTEAKTLKFYYQNASGTDNVVVQLSEDGGNTFPTNLATLGTANWTLQTIPINSNSATAVIRFRATSDYGNDDIGIDQLSLTYPLANDVGVSWAAPKAAVFYNQDIVPTINYKNFGIAANSFNAKCEIYREPAHTLVYSSSTQTFTLSPGNDTTHFWETWAAPHDTGSYQIVTYTMLPGDQDPSNDTLVQDFTIGYSEFLVVSSMPAPRLAHTTIYDPDGDKIYVLGGGDGSSYNANCWQYDPQTNSWNTSLANMPAARRWASGTYYNGKLYVVGGFAPGPSLANTIFIYDIAGNSWSTGANFSGDPCAMSAVVAHGGYIYRIGGLGGTAGLNTVEYYNPASNTWAYATSMPQTWCWNGHGIIGDRIYLIGGYTGSGTSTYNTLFYGDFGSTPDAITWSTGPSLPAGLDNCVGAGDAMGSQLFMAGGFINSASVPVSTCWRFNSADETWHQLANMPTTRIRGEYLVCRSSTKGGQFYIMGGDTSSDYSWKPSSQVIRYDWINPPTGFEGQPDVAPLRFMLAQNAPNPFRQSTAISFSLDRPSKVSLKVYNVAGQLVRTLVDGNRSPGHYQVEWNGRDDRGHKASAGVYLYRLQSGDRMLTKKLIMLR